MSVSQNFTAYQHRVDCLAVQAAYSSCICQRNVLAIPVHESCPWIGYSTVVVASLQACIVFHYDAVHSPNFQKILPNENWDNVVNW